jgi:predicted lipoprotein with Yx(FWY)xxD motif
MRTRLVVALLLAVLALGSMVVQSAVAQSAVVQIVNHPQYGMILTGANGMTLYLFTRDEPGVSNCTAGCLAAWPPLLVEGDIVAPEGLPGVLATIDRPEGGRQLTYNGWPLYFWVQDRQPGDTTGQGVNDVWFVVNVNPTVRVAAHPDHGNILVGPNGMTLYRFARDEPGVSNCTGGCLAAWPPLLVGFTPLADEGVAGIGTITRDDGRLQVTHNGWPLYFWVQDQQPGDTTGHGVNDVWFVVSP